MSSRHGGRSWRARNEYRGPRNWPKNASAALPHQLRRLREEIYQSALSSAQVLEVSAIVDDAARRGLPIGPIRELVKRWWREKQGRETTALQLARETVLSLAEARAALEKLMKAGATLGQAEQLARLHASGPAWLGISIDYAAALIKEHRNDGAR